MKKVTVEEHLKELANRVTIALIAIAGFSGFSAIVPIHLSESKTLTTLLIDYVRMVFLPEGVGLFTFSPFDALSAYLTVSVSIGVMLSLPIILYEAYRYIDPGLKPEERVAWKSIFAGSVLFILGACYAYYLIIPTSLGVLMFFNIPTQTILVMSFQSFFGFVFSCLLSSGLFFTFPMFLVLLVKVGVISIETLKQNRRIVLFILAFIMALVTPDPTIISCLLLVVPLYLLYEGSIIISGRSRK